MADYPPVYSDRKRGWTALPALVGHLLALLGYFFSGAFTVFIFTLALFLSAGGVNWSDFGIYLGLTTQFLMSVVLVSLLVVAHHIFYRRPWIKWTRLAYLGGGIVGFGLAFMILIFIAIVSTLGGCMGAGGC